MRRLRLKELLVTGTAFVAVGGTAADTWLLLADRAGAFNVQPSWYINAPLALYGLVGIPVTVSLVERLLQQVNPRPGRIVGFEQDVSSPPLRSINVTANGRQRQLLAHGVTSILGDTSPPDREGGRPAVWQVPVDDNPVIVRESELRSFLEVAYKRAKHQFSRRYWTVKRRPPLYRPKYEAFMRLLTESGLIEGRHRQGGASGYLITHPRYAITFLKFESPHAVNRA